MHLLFLWNGYQKTKEWAISAKLSSTGWPVLLRPYQVPKQEEQSLYGLIPTKEFDIPFLFHLDVMYIHVHSCAVQILWESRLRMLHAWLLFLMENFHKYIQHCHSHGTLLYGISWFFAPRSWSFPSHVEPVMHIFKPDVDRKSIFMQECALSLKD